MKDILIFIASDNFIDNIKGIITAIELASREKLSLYVYNFSSLEVFFNVKNIKIILELDLWCEENSIEKIDLEKIKENKLLPVNKVNNIFAYKGFNPLIYKKRRINVKSDALLFPLANYNEDFSLIIKTEAGSTLTLYTPFSEKLKVRDKNLKITQLSKDKDKAKKLKITYLDNEGNEKNEEFLDNKDITIENIKKIKTAKYGLKREWVDVKKRLERILMISNKIESTSETELKNVLDSEKYTAVYVNKKTKVWNLVSKLKNAPKDQTRVLYFIGEEKDLSQEVLEHFPDSKIIRHFIKYNTLDTIKNIQNFLVSQISIKNKSCCGVITDQPHIPLVDNLVFT